MQSNVDNRTCTITVFGFYGRDIRVCNTLDLFSALFELTQKRGQGLPGGTRALQNVTRHVCLGLPQAKIVTKYEWEAQKSSHLYSIPSISNVSSAPTRDIYGNTRLEK